MLVSALIQIAIVWIITNMVGALISIEVAAWIIGLAILTAIWKVAGMIVEKAPQKYRLTAQAYAWISLVQLPCLLLVPASKILSGICMLALTTFLAWWMHQPVTSEARVPCTKN